MSADSHRETDGSDDKPPAPYKLTLFDQHGPDAWLLIGKAMYGVTTFFLSLALFGALAGKLPPGVPGIFILPGVVVCSVATAALAMFVGSAGANAAGRTVTRITLGGDTTPYKEQYSYQQALVMRGELDEALRSFEAVIAEKPEAIDPRMKAAELYVRDKRSYVRAAELFRQIQRIPTVSPGEDIYSTNRLVDLLTGPLADPGRALVELRRLVDRYPNSPATAHARIALAALKRDVHGAEEAGN